MPRKEPRRRTQEERSAAMRARLLDAALDCLVDAGYTGTTTVEVAKRAGVSRGAQVHHFPTKAELVTAAITHLQERRMAEFRKKLSALPPEADRVSAAIDLLWSMFRSRDFYCTMELFVAARTDPELRKVLAPATAKFNREAIVLARELLPAAGKIGPLFEIMLALTFRLLDGMALERCVKRNDESDARLLETWKGLLRRAAAEWTGGANERIAGNPSAEESRLAPRMARVARSRR